MPTTTLRYGEHASQWVEVTVADDGAPAPLAVLVHGGFWRSAYGAEYARPLVPSLVARGWATAVVEYRRVGDGGGYPTTLDDVGAAVDLLADVEGLDHRTVVAVGHSAGGQLAAWLAARDRLPDGAPGAHPSVAVTAVVAQAGVLDLPRAAHDRLGRGAVQAFLGGSPTDVPDRYAVADPTSHLPLAVPILCVHTRDDADVPVSQSLHYDERARRSEGSSTLHLGEGDHFAPIDPDGPLWADTLDWMQARRVT